MELTLKSTALGTEARGLPLGYDCIGAGELPKQGWVRIHHELIRPQC